MAHWKAGNDEFEMEKGGFVCSFMISALSSWVSMHMISSLDK